MRLPLLALFLGLCATTQAQIGQWPKPQADASLEQLPSWMYELVKGEKPSSKWKPAGKPLHTNAFKGTWSMGTSGMRRIEFWGDAQRMVFREFNAKDEMDRVTVVDLAANIRLKVRYYKGQAGVVIQDMHVPQAGYFRELWNDTVVPTGVTRKVMDVTCTELRGVDGNKDTTYYFTTDVHPTLFADLAVWAQWLSREDDLEYLSAFSDRNAGSSLRVDWNKRQYGPNAGGMRFTAITPGKAPMPELGLTDAVIMEERLTWVNNSGTGRLPTWMRAYLGNLPPDSLPLAYTPAAVDRSIPDNRFIGTLTAETPTHYIDEHKDTTLQVAKYSYWADARRAVLQLDDPDDEGTIFYAVDLDADVVMVSRNEGHGHVIPKVEIASLETVGLAEFGRGLELDFTPQGQFRTILGRKCELNTTSERYLQYFLFPTDSVVNPVFDMRNWMVQRIGQKFKDLMFFGVADKPMPMAVNGTHLTSYKPGNAKPPVVDLSMCIVRDDRLRERKRKERPEPEIREYTIEDIEMMDVEVPMEEMEEVEEVMPVRPPRPVAPPPMPPPPPIAPR